MGQPSCVTSYKGLFVDLRTLRIRFCAHRSGMGQKLKIMLRRKTDLECNEYDPQIKKNQTLKKLAYGFLKKMGFKVQKMQFCDYLKICILNLNITLNTKATPLVLVILHPKQYTKNVFLTL